MTETINLDVCCPSCESKGIFTQYKLIDINKNPELREKIFSRNIFQYNCPVCGESIMVSYDTIYMDEEEKKIICLSSNDNEENETIRKFKLSGYSLRIVNTINGFIEKISMLEDGIDDRVIELYKLLFEEQFEEERPSSELLGVFYAGKNKENDKLYFFFITADGENCETTLSLDTYRNLYEHFLSTQFAKEDYAKIDAEWAVDALQGGVLEIN